MLFLLRLGFLLHFLFLCFLPSLSSRSAMEGTEETARAQNNHRPPGYARRDTMNSSFRQTAKITWGIKPYRELARKPLPPSSHPDSHE